MINPASERSLPVVEPLADLFPERALVRGRVVACTGPAAASAATALVAAATSSGSWLAVVGVPWFGVEAAGEAGVALRRVVSVDADPGRVDVWAERVVAALDGFEVVVAAAPADLARAAPVLRRIQQRVRARGAVLVIPHEHDLPGTGAIDLVVATHTVRWEGVGNGHGNVRSRRVAVTVTGRRMPRPVTTECWLPAPSGAISEIDGTARPEVAEVEWSRTG